MSNWSNNFLSWRSSLLLDNNFFDWSNSLLNWSSNLLMSNWFLSSNRFLGNLLGRLSTSSLTDSLANNWGNFSGVDLFSISSNHYYLIKKTEI